MSNVQSRQHEDPNRIRIDGVERSNTTARIDQVADKGPVNVLIMNLPFRVRWQDLKDLCRQACPIERADVALEFDGRSRGFGEVTCFSASDAEKLFIMFDGYEWQGRRLNVIVMPSPRLPDGATPDGGAASTIDTAPGVNHDGPGYRSHPEFRAPSSIMQPQVATDDKLLFVGNLPFSMQWQDLKDLLRPAGRVQRTDISIGSDGRSRGWGTALFHTSDEARKAVEMFNETEVEGRKIKVRLDRLGVRGLPVQPRIHQVPVRGQGMSHPTPIGYPLQEQRFPDHHTPVRNSTPMTSELPAPFSFGRPIASQEGRPFRQGDGRQDSSPFDARSGFYSGGRPY